MNYQAAIKVTASPLTAAKAIPNDMDLWWSNRIERTENGFTVRFNKSHATFTFDPGATAERFSWTCTEANMIIDDVSDYGEWTGTQLIWEIAPADSGAQVSLTHVGLTPDMECHRVCVAGWGRFFESSLKNHLNGETPSPERS